MILLFLGSWRSTIIVAVSIPLSICCSLILLAALGKTINIMTLGGLALAVGILVDDATVTIENIHRHMSLGKRMVKAILDGAHQIAIPAFVSTLCICIVFVPDFLSEGRGLLSLHPARARRGLRDDGLLFSLANRRAHHGELSPRRGNRRIPRAQAASVRRSFRPDSLVFHPGL